MMLNLCLSKLDVFKGDQHTLLYVSIPMKLKWHLLHIFHGMSFNDYDTEKKKERTILGHCIDWCWHLKPSTEWVHLSFDWFLAISNQRKHICSTWIVQDIDKYVSWFYWRPNNNYIYYQILYTVYFSWLAYDGDDGCANSFICTVKLTWIILKRSIGSLLCFAC
jgi:hypothetical protein